MITLLYIDDSPVNHHIVEKTLEGSHIAYTGCTSSAEAMELLQSHTFDIVAQDVIRPGDGLNGFGLTRWLRRLCPNEAQREVPVIIISLLDGKRLAEEQALYGYNAFFDPAEIATRLIPTIDSLLQARAR